jgi:HAD superfamily hydrolase (TIGR01509 family)
VVRNLHERKTAHYLDMLEGGAIHLRPGVQRLLMEAANHGIQQAIATTTTPANVHRLLEVTLGAGATTLFDVIGAGDEVVAKKPAPDIYRWVVGRLGLHASQCLAIEDSFDGVAAACAAEVPVVLVRSRFTPTRPCAGCIDDLPSLHATALSDLLRLHQLSQIAA